MSLPSQEILDDIRNLITEITGFQESDENFSICERYCLSHVVHHTYPFINRTTVKSLVSSYVSRFYGHGYFRVSQELNNQIESFLSNSELFEKNPQYDIQWCLLSLLSSLSSNLTSLKKLPELLSTDEEENKEEEFDWKKYLSNDQEPKESQTHSSYDISQDSEDEDENEDEEEKQKEEETKQNGELKETSANDESQKPVGLEIIFDNRTAFNPEDSYEDRRRRIEELIKLRKAQRDIENDYILRRNFTEKFDNLLQKEGINRKSQLISEFELMENILYQFQTGDKILLQKGFDAPALTSLTQETLGSFLESLQPYFQMIRGFKDFDSEVTAARYAKKSKECNGCIGDGSILPALESNSTVKEKKIPNVLYTYSVMLKKALEPFQNDVTEIVENMESYTLIQMEHKLKPHYFALTSLFHVHSLATKNWKEDPNWKSSVRILWVLYNAIMDTTSTKMSFLYLNIFLRCFQVYLDLIDSWICFVDLIDPYEEFVVAKSVGTEKSESKCSEYEIRPYKAEIEDSGDFVLIGFISEKMIQVGQSLEVLRRLNRFPTETCEKSSFRLLLQTIDEKVRSLEKIKSSKSPSPPKEQKKKSIFTLKNMSLGLERDSGGGDSLEIGSLLLEVLEEEKEKEKNEKSFTSLKESDKNEKTQSLYTDMVSSLVKNPFYKMTFDKIGIKQVQKILEETKARDEDEELMLIRKPKEENSGVYPFHKIITEAVHQILGSRVYGACALVKDIVLNENNLLTHLALLRSVLLFSDSFIIQPFVLALFSQPIIWDSSYSLSFHLKECVRSLYKDHADAVSVVLRKSSSRKCENILDVIDTITINYEVKWPLSLILNEESLMKYNEIFRLSLNLKWAHWALCSLYFNGKGESEIESKKIGHRLRLLRFWMLSALGRVHNYFLAQMIPLDLKLDSHEGLKEIITGHSEFLDKIHKNCLLGENFAAGRKLILETLIPLCMELVLNGKDFDETKLSSTETTFASCYLHLTRLLSSLEK